jgi:hypothetical protein
VKTDDTAIPDDDAERFAAAVDAGVDDAVDADLAREVAIAKLLAAHGTALDPDPEAKARAKRRLLAALADDAPDAPDARRPDGPSRAS